MKSIIIGMGEVGQALRDVLEVGDNQVFDFDTKMEYSKLNLKELIISLNKTKGRWDILHICFPYSDKFIDQVKNYQKEFRPLFTVIHSTVPVGTSRKVKAIHSPIRGLHPDLKSGILTFPKFLGGKAASLVADYFRRAGLKVVLFDKQETTEAMKLFDTEYYKTCIEFAHRVKLFCNKHDLNFHEVYTLANQTYNEGYKELGHPEFVRPVLQPIMTEIGGHCLLPNSKLIKLNE